VNILCIDRPESSEYWNDFFDKARELKQTFHGQWLGAGARHDDGGRSKDPVFDSLSIPGLEDDELKLLLQWVSSDFAIRYPPV